MFWTGKEEGKEKPEVKGGQIGLLPNFSFFFVATESPMSRKSGAATLTSVRGSARDKRIVSPAARATEIPCAIERARA